MCKGPDFSSPWSLVVVISSFPCVWVGVAVVAPVVSGVPVRIASMVGLYIRAVATVITVYISICKANTRQGHY